MNILICTLFIILYFAPCLSFEGYIPAISANMKIELYLASTQTIRVKTPLADRSFTLPAGHHKFELPHSQTKSLWAIISLRKAPEYMGILYKGQRTPISTQLSQIHHYKNVSGTIVIANLSSLNNTLTVTKANEKETVTLRPYQSIEIKSSTGTNIMLRGNYRFESAAVGKSYRYAKKSKWQPPSGSYFVVANPNNLKNSFQLKIDDPAQIEQARAIMRSGSSKIISAKIIRGSTNNWNELSEFGYKWSWSIEKFYGFYDMSSQNCDGTPALVENHLEHWIKKGNICFWTYRLIKEIKIDDDNQPAALEFLQPQIQHTTNLDLQPQQ